MESAIICLSGCGSRCKLSTMALIGLYVLSASSEARTFQAFRPQLMSTVIAVFTNWCVTRRGETEKETEDFQVLSILLKPLRDIISTKWAYLEEDFWLDRKWHSLKCCCFRHFRGHTTRKAIIFTKELRLETKLQLRLNSHHRRQGQSANSANCMFISWLSCLRCLNCFIWFSF